MPGDDVCFECGSDVYESSYNGTRVYKCSSPMTNCKLNQQWHRKHGKDEYRTPLGKTKAQVRRANAELSGQ